MQQEALLRLWRTAVHRPTPWGEMVLTTSDFGKDLNERIAHALKDVYGEWIMVITILLLLTASRQIVDYKPVDRSKLNKMRRKRQEPLLMDHTAVTMHLGERHLQGQHRGPLGYTRKSPRIHLVSRYLVTHGDRHTIVEPYWRGRGDIVERHVRVKT